MLPGGGNPLIQDAWAQDFVSLMKSIQDIYPADALVKWVAGNRANNSLIPSWRSLALPYVYAVSIVAYSHVYPSDSGFVVFRSGWNRTDNWAMMDVGQLGEGGHAHEDKLNIQIAPYGRYLLQDGDGGDYVPTEAREWAKSTFSHSCLIVDNLGQARAAQPLDLQGNDKNQSALLFETTANYDYTMASYSDLYGNASYFPVKHQREFIFLKLTTPQVWLVVDTIASADGRAHSLDVRWQFDTNRSQSISPDGGFATADPGVPNLAVIPIFSSAPTTTTSHSWEGYGGSRSAMLGVKVRRSAEDTPGLTIRTKTVAATTATAKLVHLFVPLRAGETLSFSAVQAVDSFVRSITIGGSRFEFDPVSQAGAAMRVSFAASGSNSTASSTFGPSLVSGSGCFKFNCQTPSIISLSDLASLPAPAPSTAPSSSPSTASARPDQQGGPSMAGPPVTATSAPRPHGLPLLGITVATLFAHLSFRI